MHKKGGFSDVILILLVIAVGFCGYYLYQNFPRDPIDFNSFNLLEQQVVESGPVSKQFYDRMRYQNRVIKYNIADSCPTNKANSMRNALIEIDSLTVISFISTSKEEAEITILCSDISPETEERNHFVAGEGGPSRVLDSTLYSIILQGKIALYRESQCNNDNVAIHELLHALGFDHNNNRRSILYPTLECNQEIDKEIIDSINELYEQDSLPDLTFFKASATKSGRYLSFHIEVLNRGLQPSEGITVSVFADDELVENFELGGISMGAKKLLDVENLKVPLNAERISFVVDKDNVIQEIYENNNQVNLNLITQ